MLHPAGFTLTADEQAATSTAGPHAKSALRQPRSRVHSSSHVKDNSPTPGSSRSAGERHISFNTFVTQCIAIQPGEHVPGVFDDEDDEADRPPTDWEDALSIASSESHAARRTAFSRSNSHSSDLSERLTIAPIPPTMLKLKESDDPEDDEGGFMMGRGNKAAKENGHGRRAREGPVLVYAPPTGSDSVYAPRDVNHPGVVEADAAVFDYFDAGEHRRHHHRYGSRHELPDGEITVGGCTHRNAFSNGNSENHNIDIVVGDGQVLYSTRVLNRDQLLGDPTADKAGVNTMPIISTSAVYASISGASSTSTLQQAKQERAQEERESEASIGGVTTPPIPIPRSRSPLSSSPTPTIDIPYVVYGVDERRGRTLARTSSATSLNERAKNNAGSISVSAGSMGGGNGSGVDMSPVGSLSPESSRASSSRGSSTGTGAGLGRGRGVSKMDTPNPKEGIPSGIPSTIETAKSIPSPGLPPTPPFPTSGGVGGGAGLVDKAKGILGTLLGHPSAAVASATNTTATPPPPSPHRSQF